MYSFIPIGAERVEVCAECGFNGAQVEIADVATRLGDVRRAWSAVLANDEDMLRARPRPATWCVLEYSDHTAHTLAAIEWAAREFVRGRAPDWSLLPGFGPPDATPDNHACGAIDVTQVLHEVEQASLSLASFTAGLSETDLQVEQNYGWGVGVLTTRAVVRHALHDAEHHVLDIRRGIARLLLDT